MHYETRRTQFARIARDETGCSRIADSDNADAPVDQRTMTFTAQPRGGALPFVGDGACAVLIEGDVPQGAGCGREIPTPRFLRSERRCDQARNKDKGERVHVECVASR
jgi:hypothetical protein